MVEKVGQSVGAYKFQRPANEREEIERVFRAYVDEALAEAEKIRTDRAKGYNTKVAVVDYFPHGEQDLTYELFKKLIRTENAMIAEDEGIEVDGKVEDGMIDGINYFAFLYAFRKMRKEGLI